MVLVVADDNGCHSSQNEQDTRYYARCAGVPCLEPASAPECKDFMKLAYELSEPVSYTHLDVYKRQRQKENKNFDFVSGAVPQTGAAGRCLYGRAFQGEYGQHSD